MDDILKLRELLSSGYGIEKINEDAAGNCVIILKFSGNGVPIEGERYYFITKDDAVIRKAHEVSDK
mgnify:CR=1 FL=1